jgi:uncharacterized membrane protein YccC
MDENNPERKSVKESVLRETKGFFKLRQTDRVWHIPLLAALCIGIPLLAGLYFGNLQAGLTASLSGIVILYIPSAANLFDRMATMLICSFGFMLAYAVGIIFSFHSLAAAVVFGLLSVCVHWVVLYFKVKPPGSFFFIMIASVASSAKFDLHTIPEKIGLIGMGTMLACILAFIYSLLVRRKNPEALRRRKELSAMLFKKRSADLVEAAIVGLFMFGSMIAGHLLKLQNPYWIPVSCIAVMQGATLYHIRERVFHRILGTFIGMIFCWLILFVNRTPLSICLTIIALQFIIEILVVRHYALAVIFITPMTLLLTEAANPLVYEPSTLIPIRFIDITLGSLLGAVGGWFIHNEKIRYHANRRLRKVRIALKRR